MPHSGFSHWYVKLVLFYVFMHVRLCVFHLHSIIIPVLVIRNTTLFVEASFLLYVPYSNNNDLFYVKYHKSFMR